MTRKWSAGLVGFGGLFLLTLSVFANQLGVGRSADWGPGRKIVAALGVVLISIVFLIFTWPFWRRLVEGAGKSLSRLKEIILEIPIVHQIVVKINTRLEIFQITWNRSRIKSFLDRIKLSPLIRFFTVSEDRRAASMAVLVGALVFFLYVWFASVGYWIHWPKTTSYYQQLSDAFSTGQPNLLVDPDPALLKLSDPYTMANREGISYPWDVVLFQGKFFLYWGPVPALVIWMIRAFTASEVGDAQLVFIFVFGVFIVLSLFILHIRRKFFPTIGWVYVIPGILLAGFANPMPWLLNRPAVYEAAIASGQFFLITGFFLGYLALGYGKHRIWMLILSGVFLASAVASRATLIFAAIFLVLMVSGYLLLEHRRWSDKLPQLSALMFPFAIGLIAVGWYNNIRFGNWFEFGFKYQLTGMNTHLFTFSSANLFINFHNYFLNPYRLLPTFPYLKPMLGGHFIFFLIGSPSNYYSEDITGMIFTIPFIVFAIVPVAYLIWYGWHYLVGSISGVSFADDRIGNFSIRWMTITLSGATFLAFTPILLYIAGMMRFQADVVPLLILLSVFGLFMGRYYLEGKRVEVFWFNVFVIFLTLYSVIVSLLLAVTGADARFEHLNPILFDKLTRFFTP